MEDNPEQDLQPMSFERHTSAGTISVQIEQDQHMAIALNGRDLQPFLPEDFKFKKGARFKCDVENKSVEIDPKRIERSTKIAMNILHEVGHANKLDPPGSRD